MNAKRIVASLLVACMALATVGLAVEKADTTNLAVCRADDIIGMPVKNSSNQDLGKVEDLVIDMSTGKVRYAAVSFGGFLGVGDKLFAVPFQTLKVKQNAGDNKRHFVMNVDKKALESAKGFDKKNWPDFANPTWAAENDKYFLDTTKP